MLSVTPAVQLTELEPAPTDMRGVPAAVVGQWRVWQSRESAQMMILDIRRSAARPA